MKETIIKVQGMECTGCEKRIENVLKNVEGIEKVTANHQKGEVTIEYKEEINQKEIEEKIEDLGFEIEK